MSEPLLDFATDLPATRLGFITQQVYEADLLTEAVAAAKGADLALIFVENISVWETEGQDMVSMSLPANGSQGRLISAVDAVNQNVVVINSTRVAIDMPWLSQVSAVLQAWFPGQEAGNSIIGVLFGAANPSGRLPISIPKSLADTPCYGNFLGDVKNLQVHYKEDVFIGYRSYEMSPEKILFPFGFGLSYTTFELGEANLNTAVLRRGGTINISVAVNIGSAIGSEVVQAYVAPPRSFVSQENDQDARWLRKSKEYYVVHSHKGA